MRTSTGWLQTWAVVNEPADKGVDGRVINLKLAVAANSAVAMSVAALYGRKALIGLRLPEAGAEAGAVLHATPCMIAPPWGAKKRGDFHFVSQVPFDGALVKKLTALTHGMPVEIALENAEHELDLDIEQTAVVAFVAGA